MTKIYCYINPCDASVQYFAILHADKYCMLLDLRQKTFVARHTPIVVWQNHCVLQQKISAI